MTDQELFEHLKREGECWHEWYEGFCYKCDRSRVVHCNPDFSTPEGFFWLWERAMKKGWWEAYKNWLWNKELSGQGISFFTYMPDKYIAPTSFRDSLMGFFEEEKR